MIILMNIEEMISEMREKLYLIVERKDNLLDQEVIDASQELDKILNEYDNIFNEIDRKD